MREYKFRGRRTVLGNSEWIYGYGAIDDELLTLDFAKGIVRVECDKGTIGQYAGLNDKNGKEGYESDILNTPGGKAIIRFGEYTSPSGLDKHVGFYLEFLDGNYAGLYRKDIGYWMPRSEIIGDAWDNPELLKEGSV
ncbi:MAG: YopX family protein [Caulobacteraceae bacterium]